MSPELTQAELSALLMVLNEHPDSSDPWQLYPPGVADCVSSGKQKLLVMLERIAVAA